MFCGFICLGLALGAVLTPSPEGSEIQRRQVEAFVTLLSEQHPEIVANDAQRTELREHLIHVAATRARPRSFRASAFLFGRPEERSYLARADDLAARAAWLLQTGQDAEYVRVIGEFYAEVGGYPGERGEQFMKSYLGNVVYPLAPSVMLLAGGLMLAQPELCGAEPGDVLGTLLLIAGAPLFASNGWILARARGRAWLANVGNPEVDQMRGAARIVNRFWTTLSTHVGDHINAGQIAGARGRLHCERLLAEFGAAKGCAGSACTAD